MGLFNNIFGAANAVSKQAEITKLINDTMLATFSWEQAGERSGGQEILDAATVIRKNFHRIIDLYDDLIKIHGHGNFKVKNKVLPASFSSAINVQMAIMGILQYSEAIINKNQSFKYGLISPEAMNKFSRITRGF